jgi:hypothetical protein
MINLKASLALVAFTGTLASAQLKVGSLSIKGGETFTVGQVVNVSLVQSLGQNNGKYDFYFSSNGGGSWTEIIGNFQGPKGDGDTVKYNWTIPNKPTTTGQFRACQLAGGECTDAKYILKSGNFTITTVSGVRALQEAEAAGVSFRYDAVTGSLEAAYTLASAERTSLQILSADGRVVSTLVDEEQTAGAHKISVFSNSLASINGHFILKLNLGSRSITRSWNGVP